jgi:hypothetical protein
MTVANRWLRRRFVTSPSRWSSGSLASQASRCCHAAGVVEHSFGWMIRWRRLVRDYERRIDVSESMIYVAMGGLLLKRIHS